MDEGYSWYYVDQCQRSSQSETCPLELVECPQPGSCCQPLWRKPGIPEKCIIQVYNCAKVHTKSTDKYHKQRAAQILAQVWQLIAHI
jgi:hypothetical protein